MTVYCPASECDACAGVGERLTDAGIRECEACRGVGRQACQVDALRRELERLRAEAIHVAAAAWTGICLSALAIVMTVVQAIFGRR